MPNMFGGDQFHPDYNPETQIRPNQVLISGVLYTASPDGSCAFEAVDGRNGSCAMPEELKQKLARQGEIP